MNNLAASEFILNDDGSIYHLNLRPEQVANTVIFVGDPERVEKITRHFDRVESVVRKREFHTQTGTYLGKRLTVISTGIGTDNIDIVLNELDALVNIDFKTRQLKENKTSLDIVRIGTSGSIQQEIPVDSFLISKLAVGFDALLHYYQSEHIQLQDFNRALEEHLQLNPKKSKPYVVACDAELAKKFASAEVLEGFTATNIGFYGPQSRTLRLPLKDEGLKEKIASFSFKNKKITNLEMETSGIYGMAHLLGHRAVSLNAIIANRPLGQFTKDGAKTVENLIQFTLDRLASS